MPEIASKLTVFFETPFWVGVYERISDGTLEVSKITFGAEPKEYEVYDFLLQHWHQLEFSAPIKTHCSTQAKINPKRMQRVIKTQLKSQGIGTKSQRALKLQQEENKTVRQSKSRQQKEEAKQRKFALHTQKRKEKHKGR